MSRNDLGGGAEAHARNKQYELRANSSLVLNTDSRPRDTHEPTGEPESLWGKIDPRSFGDRAYRGRPAELDDKPSRKKKKKKERDADDEPAPIREKRRRIKEQSVLNDTEEGGVYQPRTRETQAAYEIMLRVIQQQLGGQPFNIISGAADEILAVLKNDNLLNRAKKSDIGKLLNPIPDSLFDLFVKLGAQITDYHDGSNGDEGLDDNVGVAVEFEENEDDEQGSDLDVVQEDGDEDDGDVGERACSGAMQMGGEIDDVDMQEPNECVRLNVQDIDAYWLQRKISEAYDKQIDPQQCQKLAEELLGILPEGDDRDVESKLLQYLDFKNFDLIKLLLPNRLKIFWCTRLARAQCQDERKGIEEEMLRVGLASIVDQLHATRASAKERQQNLERGIREEAQKLKTSSGDGDVARRGLVGGDGDNGCWNSQSQLLDRSCSFMYSS